MKRLLFLVLLLSGIYCAQARGGEDPKTLALGADAPDFSLPGIDGKTYNLSSFSTSPYLLVVFTCNHCPTAQAYEERLIAITRDYQSKGLAVVAIMPNDPSAVRLDELGYTDLNDHFDEMKIRAERKNFNFPYLYDGETQSTAKAYGPAVTPHVFIFDQQRKLRYQGRIDDVEKPGGNPNHTDTRNALDDLISGKAIAVPTTKVFGCSIKWADKKNTLVKQADDEWKQEPVTLNQIDISGVRSLVGNHTDTLLLINVWATWCGPCIIELPEFVEINRMYRGRDFALITICIDDTARRAKALKILSDRHVSARNYLFNIDQKYDLIEAIDPNWQGALPYTLLVEPGGKIVYAKQNTIEPEKMKTMIVENKYIGRYY